MPAMGYGDDSEVEGEELPKLSQEVKLKELLRNLNSAEIKLCSNASKDFIKLLRGRAGGELLRLYVRNSSKLTELDQAWNLQLGKPGLSYVLKVISAILSHPDGVYNSNDTGGVGISRALDKFSRSIIEEKLGGLYKELNSKEVKRQNAALLVLASVVRRGSGLASDVAKSFDFKLPIFPKLAEYKAKRIGTTRKHSTRQAFVGLAMSFLEVGKPGLLRWVLQQKEMYSGVLRGIGSDDDETVVYVLSTLRDMILIPESLVPPSLRSVLFGSVTLEQLVNISGREDGRVAAELAHRVLVIACTDPSNGLMPDLNRQPNPLKGNLKRLLDLMKKLKATEVDYHRDLLLAIVKGRPLFGSAFMDEFPYNVEDNASPNWLGFLLSALHMLFYYMFFGALSFLWSVFCFTCRFFAVSLAANLVSSVGSGLSFDFKHEDPPSFSNPDVQSLIKCICPRPFTRAIVNKGLLHTNSLMKHGILRLVLEELKLLDSLTTTIESTYCSSDHMRCKWLSLKQDIQNEVRILLPDTQVLLSLLSSLSTHSKSLESSLKRTADSEISLEQGVRAFKRFKTDSHMDDVDILVSGVCNLPEITLQRDTGVVQGMHDVNDGDDNAFVIADIWGLRQCSKGGVTVKDEETHFYSKLLDAFKIYHVSYEL